MPLLAFEKITLFSGLFLFVLAVVALVFGVLGYLEDHTAPYTLNTTNSSTYEIPAATNADMFLVPKEAGSSEVVWTNRPHSHGTGKTMSLMHLISAEAVIPTASQDHNYTIAANVFQYPSDTLLVEYIGEYTSGNVQFNFIQGAFSSTVTLTWTTHDVWSADFVCSQTSSNTLRVISRLHDTDSAATETQSSIQTIGIDPRNAWSLELTTGSGSPKVHMTKILFAPVTA